MADYDLQGKRVWVAGHRGMVGRALLRALTPMSATVLTAERAELDLRDQAKVNAWLDKERPQAVFVAAAKVGGILANATYPADFIYDNLIIEANIIAAAHRVGVEKLLFLGSTCIYPKFAAQPIAEASLMTGPLEPTNEWYAIAKIAGIKLCQAFRVQHGCRFISAMPTNLYGPHDNFDLSSSHVLPALIRKAHDAKRNGSPVTIWGTGTPRREFMHVDDLASALIFLMQHYDDAEQINVGTGEDISIRELAEIVADCVGYRGGFEFDRSKPDGTPRKLTDVTRLNSLGWSPSIRLPTGVRQTYQWYLDSLALQ